jgi:hypothetical protein
MKIKRILSALAAAGLCSATSALAQAPPMDPLSEFNCRHGIPADPERSKASMERIQKTMSAYFALSSASTPKQVKALFYDDDNVTWQEGDQYVPLDQVPSHLSPPLEPPKLVVAVHGGDNWTTRTIWSGRDTNGPAFYAVDLTNGAWLASASIYRVKITHGETAPDTPPAYCHAGPGKPYTGNLDDDRK